MRGWSTGAFINLLKAGDFAGAGQSFRHADVASIEALDEPAVLHGRPAVAAKTQAFREKHEVTGFTVTGPILNANQFTLQMTIDATIRATGERMNMIKAPIYTIQDDKIIEEHFFTLNQADCRARAAMLPESAVLLGGCVSASVSS